MTGYQLVKKAIEFDYPERVPMRFDACGFSDTYSVTRLDDRGLNLLGKQRAVTDEWGCVWEKTDACNMGQVKGHPLADWQTMESYVPPDPQDPTRYEGIEEALKGAGDKYVLAYSHFALFERMHFLRGYVELLEDFYLEPKRVHHLADIVLEYQVGIAKRLGALFRGRVHGFWTTDDWGTQCSTVISLPLWREFFKPRYRKLFDAVHDAGMHIWMHSCGKVNDVVGEWIEVGVDVVNLQQSTLLGIEEIGRRYAGKVCFESPVDIQKTLQQGTPEEIRAEARLLLEKWGTPEGGFIASDYGQGEAIGVPMEKKWVMFNAFAQYGKLR